MENKTSNSKPETNAGLSDKERLKIEKKHARRESLKAKAKDFLNPQSEFRGGGRILQLTGTDKMAKRLLSSMGGGGNNYSDEDLYSNPNKDKLKRWFDEKWIDVKTGKPCGRSSSTKSKRNYPACRPSVRINSDTPKTSGELSKEEKDNFTKVKTSEKRISYNHKKDSNKDSKSNYNKNTPTNKKLYASVVASAKKKFNKWPSAYASGWVVKTYKEKGGTYSKSKDSKYSFTFTELERDNLVVNGFYEEVKIIQKCESGSCTKNKAYYDALDKIVDYKQRNKKQTLNNNKKFEKEFSEETIYSSWNLLSKFCNE